MTHLREWQRYQIAAKLEAGCTKKEIAESPQRNLFNHAGIAKAHGSALEIFRVRDHFQDRVVHAQVQVQVPVRVHARVPSGEKLRLQFKRYV